MSLLLRHADRGSLLSSGQAWDVLPLPGSLVPAVGENTQNGEIKLPAPFWKQGTSPLQGQEGYSWVLFL